VRLVNPEEFAAVRDSASVEFVVDGELLANLAGDQDGADDGAPQ
jgi:hypothetical protein